MKTDKKLFTGIATLTGTIIGAGFLGIPYVVAKSGFLFGLLHMILISLVMLIVNLMIGEICLATSAIHQLPGYASKYLGRKTKLIIFLASIFGLYSALIAYLLGEGESLSFIFSGTSDYNLLAGIIFWLAVAFISVKGIRRFKKIEPLGVIAVFVVTLVFGIFSFNKLDFRNLSYINYKMFFYPFGVVLFSFLGTSAIPEMRRVLMKNEKLMKKAIIIGSLIPLVVYTLFVIVVLGLYGEGVSEIATISLGKVVTLLGIFTMFTAFLALNLALQDTYRFDFELKSKTAWLLSTFLPLIAFIFIRIFNLASFVKILSLGGTISGGVMGITMIIIHEKLKSLRLRRKMERRPEFRVNVHPVLKVLMAILFIIGIVYEFL
ncbi:MAG: aromatic amino acid transport family protein [Candidatus Pacearchaeota archaeon]